jgi:drug/metabolite transporter (DMT)-like permease
MREGIVVSYSQHVGARVQALRQYFEALPAVWRGMLWVALSGFIFTVMNAELRRLTMQLDPFQAQFLRYLMGALVMLPLLMRHGWAVYKPKNLKGQFWRGAVHSLALVLWFTALPRIGLAETTAIGFTGPIFVMLGAAWFLGERMRWERWVAALFGLSGVLVVVGPKLGATDGWFTLVMLGSAPLFAASFLITKTLTRTESAGSIVLWQSFIVALLSLPLGLIHWEAPTAWQWIAFAVTGVLGSTAHYCMARGFGIADISATQSLKFLDLIWAAGMGFLVFGDIPTQSTVIGASVILLATIWIANREHRRQY